MIFDNDDLGSLPGVCEDCGVSNDNSRRPVVVYVEEYGTYLCGACETKHEERKRQRLAEANEY